MTHLEPDLIRRISRGVLLFLVATLLSLGVLYGGGAALCKAQLYCGGYTCFNSAVCGRSCVCLYAPGASSGRCQLVR